jgi:hypothetical protein
MPTGNPWTRPLTEAPNKQIFAVIALRNPDAIAKKIRSLEVPSLAVRDDVWLASYGGTTKEFAEALGIRSGEIGAGLVIPVVNYSGRAASEIWEWLKVNRPKND